MERNNHKFIFKDMCIYSWYHSRMLGVGKSLEELKLYVSLNADRTELEELC